MPTYEYECTKCGAVVEIFQPITEAPRKKLKKEDPKPCSCDAAVQRRIGTGGGIIFKGSGFYSTDYRSDSYKKSAKSESDSSSGEKPKAEKESGSTKAPKSDAKDASSKSSSTTSS